MSSSTNTIARGLGYSSSIEGARSWDALHRRWLFVRNRWS